MAGITRTMRLRRGRVYLIAPMGAPKSWTKGKGKWPMKIGVSKSMTGVFNRLKDLSSGNWMKLCVEYVSAEVSEPYNVEWFLHTYYAKRKLRGEWFNLSFAEYENIIRLLDKEPDSHCLADYGRGDMVDQIQYDFIEY